MPRPARKISISIKGISFQASAPYHPGFVCSEVEAAVLNQTRANNIRNNFTATVQAFKDSGGTDLEALRAKFDEYDRNYSFRAPISNDPIDIEARRIATSLVREELNRRGTDPESISKDRLLALVERTAAVDSVQAEARRRHAARLEAATQTGIIFDANLELP